MTALAPARLLVSLASFAAAAVFMGHAFDSVHEFGLLIHPWGWYWTVAVVLASVAWWFGWQHVPEMRYRGPLMVLWATFPLLSAFAGGLGALGRATGSSMGAVLAGSVEIPRAYAALALGGSFSTLWAVGCWVIARRSFPTREQLAALPSPVMGWLGVGGDERPMDALPSGEMDTPRLSNPIPSNRLPGVHSGVHSPLLDGERRGFDVPVEQLRMDAPMDTPAPPVSNSSSPRMDKMDAPPPASKSGGRLEIPEGMGKGTARAVILYGQTKSLREAAKKLGVKSPSTVTNRIEEARKIAPEWVAAILDE